MLPGGLVELTCADSSFLDAVAGSLRTLPVRTTGIDRVHSRLHPLGSTYKMPNTVIVVKPDRQR